MHSANQAIDLILPPPAPVPRPFPFVSFREETSPLHTISHSSRSLQYILSQKRITHTPMTSYDTRSSLNGGQSSRYSGNSGPRGAQPASESDEFKQLWILHASKLHTLKELFAEWKDEDLLFALQDAGGDLELTISRISEGNFDQFCRKAR